MNKKCGPKVLWDCMPRPPVTLVTFADQIKKDHPRLKRCYIAIMSIDGQYDLEVEIVPLCTIGGAYRTTEKSLKKARTMANRLDTLLKKRGIRVVKTRDEWEG